MNRTAFSIISRYTHLLSEKRKQFEELGEFTSEIEQQNAPLEASKRDRVLRKRAEIEEEIEEIENFLNELKLRYKLL